jgi:DNA-binding transcriptional ArsR family regulator
MSDGGPDRGRATTDTALDAVFDLLSDRRRRRALYYLAATDGCSLSDLVDAVADAEAADAIGPSTDDQSAVRLSLVHVHLPRLAEAGVASVDRENERVDYHPDRRLSACLDWAQFEEREDPARSVGSAPFRPRGP